jgi:hypothetical protein
MVVRRKSALKKAEELRKSSGELCIKITALDEEIDSDITAHLLEHDPGFKAAYDQYVAILALRDSSEDCERALDTALNEIDGAQSMETADLFSGNKGIGFLSYLENDEASDAIEAAQEALVAFGEALKKYDQTESTLRDIKSQINDFPDLMLDLTLDLPFDFLSWSMLSQLDDCEDELRRIWDELDPLWVRIDAATAAAEKVVDDLRQKMRDSI